MIKRNDKMAISKPIRTLRVDYVTTAEHGLDIPGPKRKLLPKTQFTPEDPDAPKSQTHTTLQPKCKCAQVLNARSKTNLSFI